MRVRINSKDKSKDRIVVEVEVIKWNYHTIIVRLPDGHHIKRKVGRDYLGRGILSL